MSQFDTILILINQIYNRNITISKTIAKIIAPSYTKLIQNVQDQDTEIDYCRLRVTDNNDKYQPSLTNIDKLKDHPNVIRFMTYNIFHWGDWSSRPIYGKTQCKTLKIQTGLSSQDSMLDDILNVSPTILCLQEYVDLPDQNTDYYRKFIEKYELKGKCKADFNLYNAIYIKKNSEFDLHIINDTKHNIQCDIYGGERCGVFGNVIFNGKIVCAVANIHFDVNNTVIRSSNVERTLEIINDSKNRNKIIIGDFNSYRRNDYSEEQFKILEGIKAKHGDVPTETTQYLETNGWKDTFTHFSNL